MNIFDFAEKILNEGSLEDKLLSATKVKNFDVNNRCAQRISNPRRNPEISFSNEQIKFPKKGALKDPKNRGKALHFFANHELLAIEMMAQAILLFPDLGESRFKVLLQTIFEEQKHLSLYLNRMRDFDVSFGDYPLNNFFWTFMERIETPEEFFSVISLTFEQANLDFCHYYQEVFLEIGDSTTAEILKIVYEDEIKHVARGKVEMERTGGTVKNLWDYYCMVLPIPLTPARAKGILFDKEGRQKAGLGDQYIKALMEYRDEFNITSRKQWKKN